MTAIEHPTPFFKKTFLALKVVLIIFLTGSLISVGILLFTYQKTSTVFNQQLKKNYDSKKQPNIKRVFILNSFNLDYIWTKNMLQGINESLTQSDLNIQVITHFMDMKRINYCEEYFARYKQMIKEGYQHIKFDTVIACDNDAFDFLTQYRDEIFPQVPMVFVSINDYSDAILQGRHDLTGTSENTDYISTIKMALTILPQTKKIIVLVDNTTTGQAHQSAVKKIENRFNKQVQFEYLSFSDNSIENTGKILSSLKNDTIILLLQHFIDQTGQSYTIEESTPYLTSRASVPCFILSDIRIGFGPIGGCLVSGYHHGMLAADMVLKILKGTNVSDIPVLLKSTNQFMFDYPVLRRFNISLKDLPPGSIIINKPESIMTKYKKEVISVVIIFATIIIALIILIMEVLLRIKVEDALQKKQDLISRILSTSPSGIVHVDQNGLVVFANKVAANILNVNNQELLVRSYNDPLWNITDYDGNPFPEENLPFNLVSKSHKPVFGIRHAINRTDGKRILLSINSAPIFNPKGEFYGIVSAIEDVTTRLYNEQQLAEEKERLAVTLRSIGDGVITTDILGQITIMNKAAEELTGWRSAEAFGRSLNEVFTIIHEFTRKPCENPFEKILRAEKTVEFTNNTLLITKDGREMIITNSGAPIKDGDGRCIGIVLVFRDITEKQKLLESMQLTQKLESIGILAGGIAHDFNNLLSGIFGYITLAIESLSKNDYKETANLLSKVLMVYERTKGLTHQLLTFAKGGSPIKKTLDLQHLITNSVKFALSGSNVTCRYELDPDLWNCDCDETQISQVMDNLVINAIQSMQAGGLITVSANNHTFQSDHLNKKMMQCNYIHIKIKDQGTGIPKEILSYIFDPFFTTKEKGHGLGLATVHSIIQKHNGWIEVDSELGKGSIFHIYLPASNTAISNHLIPQTDEYKGCGKILIMDDEDYLREIFAEILLSLGFTVDTAKNGEEVLVLYQQTLNTNKQYDLLILDITIPGSLGGKDVIQSLQKMNPNIAIIVTSGYSDDPVMSNPADYGFSGRLIKPFQKKELIEAIRQILK